jgi:hypothetical protein
MKLLENAVPEEKACVMFLRGIGIFKAVGNLSMASCKFVIVWVVDRTASNGAHKTKPSTQTSRLASKKKIKYATDIFVHPCRSERILHFFVISQPDFVCSSKKALKYVWWCRKVL